MREINKTVLDNGLTVVIDKESDAKTVTLKYVIAAGSFDENEHNAGCAHFVEHMLFKGTRNRTFNDINVDIAAIGGVTNAATSQSSTEFYIASPADTWKENLHILSDMIWNSILPEEEFKKEKTVIIEELKMYEDSPEDKCVEQIDIMINENNVSRQRVGGTVESVRNLTVDDLREFMNTFYIPNNMCLIASGNIPSDEFLEEVIDLTWDKKQEVIPERGNIYNNEIMDNQMSVIYRDDISQAHYTFAVKGVPPYDQLFDVESLIVVLLGKGFIARLYNIIREQLGLAYTVTAYAVTVRDASYIEGYCALSPENIEKVHSVVSKELNRLKYELVPEDELDTVKAYIKGSILLSLETTSSKTSLHADNFIYNTNNTIESLLENLQNITPDDIKEFAQKFFKKQNICYSVVTPHRYGKE